MNDYLQSVLDDLIETLDIEPDSDEYSIAFHAFRAGLQGAADYAQLVLSQAAHD